MADERFDFARVFNNWGNRRVPSAKAKAKAKLETRTVFKAALDNPFEINWFASYQTVTSEWCSREMAF